MSLNKFGRFVHPYYRKDKHEKGTADIVQPSNPRVYRLSVNLHGCETDTYTDRPYKGKNGKITEISGSTDGDWFTINDGEWMDKISLIGKFIKFGDVLTVYHRDTVPEVTITVDCASDEDYSYTFNESLSLYRRVFKYVFFESGIISYSDVTPADIHINGEKFSSLDYVTLNYGDVIKFYPKVKHFEANLQIEYTVQ